MDQTLTAGGRELPIKEKEGSTDRFVWQASWIWGGSEDWPRNEWRRLKSIYAGSGSTKVLRSR